MAKVSINPTAEVIAKANEEVTVTDDKGRSITLKRPGVLAQFRLIELLGDSAKNEVYVGMVLPLIFVSAIDGEPVFPFAKKSQVEALIQQLDEEGIAAVSRAVQENFGSQNREETRERLKN